MINSHSINSHLTGVKLNSKKPDEVDYSEEAIKNAKLGYLVKK